ncbi:unnamed protein product [marine sediment metagenome]|uniref:Uncharacterized protein n=1 Tax=marine sediment metagenome TaxID=412755 RepID=X1SKT0_9ZZZZ
MEQIIKPIIIRVIPIAKLPQRLAIPDSNIIIPIVPKIIRAAIALSFVDGVGELNVAVFARVSSP